MDIRVLGESAQVVHETRNVGVEPRGHDRIACPRDEEVPVVPAGCDDQQQHRDGEEGCPSTRRKGSQEERLEPGQADPSDEIHGWGGPQAAHRVRRADAEGRREERHDPEHHDAEPNQRDASVPQHPRKTADEEHARDGIEQRSKGNVVLRDRIAPNVQHEQQPLEGIERVVRSVRLDRAGEEVIGVRGGEEGERKHRENGGEDGQRNKSRYLAAEPRAVPEGQHRQQRRDQRRDDPVGRVGVEPQSQRRTKADCGGARSGASEPQRGEQREHEPQRNEQRTHTEPAEGDVPTSARHQQCRVEGDAPREELTAELVEGDHRRDPDEGRSRPHGWDRGAEDRKEQRHQVVEHRLPAPRGEVLAHGEKDRQALPRRDGVSVESVDGFVDKEAGRRRLDLVQPEEGGDGYDEQDRGGATGAVGRPLLDAAAQIERHLRRTGLDYATA